LGQLGQLGQVLFAGGALCRVFEVHGRVLSWEKAEQKGSAGDTAPWHGRP